MSSDSDEQSEYSAAAEEQNLRPFRGFDGSAFLHYRVLNSELDSEAELGVLDRLNATEQLIARAIDDSGDTYRELEGVSDRLRALSPSQGIDAEFEIAQFRTDLSLSPQHRTSTRRNSLVNQRVSFFENMSTTSGSSSFMITTTASMASTTTTTSTTSSSISSAGGSGHGSIPAVIPLGAAHAVAPVDSQWLEYRVQFACDDLRARAPNISAQLDEEDDNHELTKRIILNEMQALLIECEEYNNQFNMYCAGIERERQDTYLTNIGNYRRALR